MIGKTISHYRIVEKLGGGGMGVVYRAEDTKLKRTVALKFLAPELTRDEEAKIRFIYEAQAAAAITHQSICTVYEVGEHEGQSFIAMEFIEGQSLEERVGRGPLPMNDAISFAVQIGEGLGEAHAKQIVHRDIKPANIIVTERGQAKILDFGLARLGGQIKLTKMDTTLGTAAYMSPEQTSGKDVDRRTDIWSLGVVLYEMIAGQRPFVGDYEAAVVHSILNDDPEPLTARRSNVPMELERIVGKALAKNASERYQHVEDMLVDLRALQSDTQRRRIAHPRERSRGKRRAIIAGGAALIAIACGIAIALRVLHPATEPPQHRSADGRTMIVVLPFENLGAPEDAYFANGITDAITARLAGVSGLGVISRQSALQYRETNKTTRQIGHELGVDYILEGTVQRERPGDPTSRVRVIPQLIRVADDTHVWAQTYDRDMTDVFRVQSGIAERVARQLDVTLLEAERQAMEKKPTENLAAYEDFMRGADLFESRNRADVELAVELFQKAVSLDSRFTQAWAALAMAQHYLYWVYDRPGALALQMEAAKRAQELAPDLPETQIAMGDVAYAQRDFERALKHFERAESLTRSGEAATAICRTLRRLGRWEDAINYAERARRLMPRSYNVRVDYLGYTKACLRQFDEAEQDLEEAVALSPHLTAAYIQKASILVGRDGDVEGAERIMLEMSRRTNIAEAAEGAVAQGLIGSVVGFDLRIFPEIYKDVFEAFEAGPVNRYRNVQPAVVAGAHLGLAIIYEAMGDQRSATARYDSASIYYERVIRSNPQSAYVCLYHASLGRAYAGLGRSTEAIREGEEAVRMIPIAKDAIVGPDVVANLAEIYVRCGDHEAAIDQIETLLAVPSDMSTGRLRVDHMWDPLRTNPRFRRLLEAKQVSTGAGLQRIDGKRWVRPS